MFEGATCEQSQRAWLNHRVKELLKPRFIYRRMPTPRAAAAGDDADDAGMV